MLISEPNVEWFVEYTFHIANEQFGLMILLHYVRHKAIMASLQYFKICILDNGSAALCYYRDEPSN